MDDQLWLERRKQESNPKNYDPADIDLQRVLNSPTSPWRSKAATDKQRTFLSKYRCWQDGMTRGEAADKIKELLHNNSFWPGYLDIVRDAKRDYS